MLPMLTTTPSDLELISYARRAAANGDARQIREDALLSQSDLARTIGTTPATVSRWEAGKRVPWGDMAVRYARVLTMLKKPASREASPTGRSKGRAAHRKEVVPLK